MLTNDTARKFAWIGHGAFPGKAPFRFGTVCAHDAQEAREALLVMWRETMPVEPPDFEPERGRLIFFPGAA